MHRLLFLEAVHQCQQITCLLSMQTCTANCTTSTFCASSWALCLVANNAACFLQELTWLVTALVASKNMFEAERLLASYVLTRRNTLSSTAAVEHALVKAATASFIHNQDALQLAKRFRAAKHALLRQLMKRYSDEQKGCAAATAAEDSSSLHAPGSDSLRSQLSHLPGSGHHMQQSSTPLMLLDPLLHTVKLCMQELTAHTIGRGGGAARFSIHDSSPYSLALSLGDSEFLGLQPVREYTRLIWHGLELHRMRRVMWQAVASPEEAAAADGPFASSQISRQRAGPGAYGSSQHAAGTHAAGLSGSGAALHENASGSNSKLPALGASTAKWAARVSRRTTMHASHTPAAGSGSAAARRAAAAGSSPAIAAAGSSWMDPHVGYDLLQNLGLAGGLGSQLVLVGAFLLHGVLVAPRALHDSSWGRWVKRMVFEIFFIVVYQMSVLGGPHSVLLCAFPFLLLGNVLDIIFQLQFKYGDSLVSYMQDH